MMGFATSRARRGVTFVDLLAVLGLSGVVAAGGMSAIQQQWEQDNRIRCAANLRQIGQAMRQYAIDDVRGGAFPRTIYSSNTADSPVFGTPYATDADLGGHVDADPFMSEQMAGDEPSRKALVKYTPAPNDVTAALWHLYRESDLTPDVFVCPSTRMNPFTFAEGEQKMHYTNWRGEASLRDHLSYSIQNMYFNPGAVGRGFKWTDSMRSPFIIMADMNPGTEEALREHGQASGGGPPTAILEEAAAYNSHNHFGHGQNVLHADGAVRFSTSPLVGPRGDNIWTYRSDTAQDQLGTLPGGGFVGSAFDREDCLLLPTATQVEQPAETLPTDAEIEAMKP